MTRSVRHGLLGPLLLGLIGAAFADMKTTSAEAEVKNMLISRASKTTVPASGTLCTFRDLKWQSRDSHLPKSPGIAGNAGSLSPALFFLESRKPKAGAEVLELFPFIFYF